MCAVSALADGDAIRVPAGTAGTSDAVAVFNDGGRYYALDDTCPHAEASLSEGWIEDGLVECPLHQALFDLATGAVLSPPATRDATPRAVEVRDGGLWLSVSEAADERSPS